MAWKRSNRGRAVDGDVERRGKDGIPDRTSGAAPPPENLVVQPTKVRQRERGGVEPVIAPRADAGTRKPLDRVWSPARLSGRISADVAWWSVILVLPYAVVFLLFVLYPIAYGLWLGSSSASYDRLFNDPVYLRTLRNTLLFVGLGVNVKLFLGLLLSGFFYLSHRWIGVLFLIFILPWAVPSIPTILSFRWMLNSEWGMFNNLLDDIGIGGRLWLIRPNLALGAGIVVHIWKWLPFWTLILLAGRMAIPKDIYEAAAIDGASGFRSFVHVTFPMLSTLYLTCTLLSTIWTLGDFNSIYLLTGGGPFDTTHVMATLSIRYAFTMFDIRTGVAVALTALPVIIPIVIYLVRRLGKGEPV